MKAFEVTGNSEGESS